jgi:hypothetical protein
VKRVKLPALKGGACRALAGQKQPNHAPLDDDYKDPISVCEPAVLNNKLDKPERD